MRTLLIAAMLTCSLFSALPGVTAERILQEWDFSKAADTLGWAAAEPIDNFRVVDGALAVSPGPGIPKLESPLFEIDASPWEYVEVDMKSDTGAEGLMYYSNTTAEPYHGFRGDQFARFQVQPGSEFRTYPIFPFWQKHGKITHIRIDPPGKNAAIRAIRIIRLRTDPPTTETAWKFKGDAAEWQAVGSGGKIESGPRGVELSGSRDVTFVSPAIDVPAEDRPVATLRLASKTEHVVLLKWAGASVEGMQSTALHVMGDAAVHSYVVDLNEIPQWTGRIRALALSPSDNADKEAIFIESVTLANAPAGPAELQITRFGLDQPFVRVGQKAKLVVEAKNVGGSDARSVEALVALPSGISGGILPAKPIAILAPGKVARFEYDIVPKKAGEQQAVCRVTANEIDSGQKTIYLHYYPVLDKSEDGNQNRPGLGGWVEGGSEVR